jgi:hypothetical protein
VHIIILISGEVPAPASTSTHAPLPLDRVIDVKVVDDSVRSPDEEQKIVEPDANVSEENEELLTDNEAVEELRLIIGMLSNEIAFTFENIDRLSDPLRTFTSENDKEDTPVCGFSEHDDSARDLPLHSKNALCLFPRESGTSNSKRLKLHWLFVVM